MTAPKKKPRQPVAGIGAMTLYKLAHAALLDVHYGDDEDPYVKDIRSCATNALKIAFRRMGAKGLTPKDFR